ALEMAEQEVRSPPMRIQVESHCCMRRRASDGVVIYAGVMPCLLGLHLLVLACFTAAAQTPGPDAPPSEPANPSMLPSGPQGFFDAFGNWVQQGVANVGAGFGAMVGAVERPAGQAAKGAADAARSAATSVTKIPSGVTGGRERCILAPNGAPDCQVAAQAL